jgi:hypothetical protein
MEKIKILIPERMAGKRLDASLAEILPNILVQKSLSIKSGDA